MKTNHTNINQWDRELALNERKAVTRDGRFVGGLKEVTLDGRKVLSGLVTRKRMPFKSKVRLKTDYCIFSNGGFAGDGDSDLFNYIPD